MAIKEYVCRCEEVTREDILYSLQQGDGTPDAIKKRTRAGMGYCQGKNCKNAIARMLASHLQQPVEKFLTSSVRYPVGAVTLKILAETEIPESE